MSELLNHYFKLRMDKDPVIPSVNDEPGPVITISRDYGCPGKKVAEKLTNILSSTYTADWTWIDKEVLDKLSKELNLNPSVIDDLSNFTDRKLSDYIALIFSSDYYPGEKKIKNTMAEIILSFANKGNTVILGRAGFLVTKHIKNSFHLKLTAPFDWRVERISIKRGISFHEAYKEVMEFKIKREQFLKFYSSDTNTDSHFDEIYDCSIMTVEEILNKAMKGINKRIT